MHVAAQRSELLRSAEKAGLLLHDVLRQWACFRDTKLPTNSLPREVFEYRSAIISTVHEQLCRPTKVLRLKAFLSL